MKRQRIHAAPSVTALEFFAHLKWLDGKPLQIEPYRRAIFASALDQYEPDGRPRYNAVLAGRAKKNYKTLDLLLAALYKLVIPQSDQGNDALILSNDEEQAGDGLSLAKKLVRCNRSLFQDSHGADELQILRTEIRRRDGAGSLKILPAQDAIGSHGKTALFVGFDEIHGYRDWDIIESLQPDPTRVDALTWFTTYDVLSNTTDTPLHDLKKLAMSGADPRLLFSWYSGDYCTDPAFRDLPPEQRANPSMASWPDGAGYLEQQRRRLPTFRYRRLHLNLPGPAAGAFLDADNVLASIVQGRRKLSYSHAIRYSGFVDMSGGSADDAALAIAHQANGKVVVDLAITQAGKPPFNPRQAVFQFATTLREYRLRKVSGDAYAGETFRRDFENLGIKYEVSSGSASDLYEALEPRLNAGEVQLLDIPKLSQQLLGLVVKGLKVTHPPGAHDDLANAVAGAVAYAAAPERRVFSGAILGAY
jgi:phage terminase large subunit-like protein